MSSTTTLRWEMARTSRRGVKSVIVPLHKRSSPGSAFATIVDGRIGWLIAQPDQFFTVPRDQLVLQATRHAIPTIFGSREFAVAGGLTSEKRACAPAVASSLSTHEF